MYSRLLTAALLVFGLYCCQTPPDYPDEPVIEFLSMNKNTMLQGSGLADTVLITFSFTDGDGDLGRAENSQDLDIFLTDLRKNAPADNYRIPFIPELGAGNGIRGEVTFKLFQTCCIYPNGVPLPCTPNFENFPQDTVAYELFIVDRAGNESNRIQTEDIYIQCR